MAAAGALWLVALAALVALGLVMAHHAIAQGRRADEADQLRAHHLRRFAAQLSEGRLAGEGPNAEVLGVFQGRRVRVSFRHDGARVWVCCVLTVAPRGLRELDVTREGVLAWLRRQASAHRRVEAEGLALGEGLRVASGGERERLEGLLLDGRLEAALTDLLGGLGFPRLLLRSDMLRVERPLERDDPLDELERIFACLREVAWLCEGKEVRILGPEPGTRLVWTAGTPTPRCPYCFDAVVPEGEAVAACGACGTVHHGVCLEEAGGCTVFGCQGGPPLRAAPTSA